MFGYSPIGVEKYEFEKLVRHLISIDINDEYLQGCTPLGESTYGSVSANYVPKNLIFVTSL